MADKMSWTELRRTLAARANVSEKEANAFLTALQAQLKEALKNDKQVKINGLGSFRLQAVAPRKSVNVSTGEEIIIDGYNKIAFAPEAGVRELIEKGGENIVLGDNEQQAAGTDPIQKLGAQAEEIVGILDELGQMPNGEEPAAEEPVVEEPAPEEPATEEPAPVVEPAPVYTPSFVREPEPVEEPAPQKPKKKSHFFRDVLICLLVLLLLLCLIYYFFRPQINAKLESLLQLWPAQTEQPAEPVTNDTTVAVIETEQETSQEAESNTAAIPEGTISQEQILAEFLEASREDDDEQITGSKEDYPGLITIEPIHEGSRLAWMAKRYYGSKTYWPYIFDANRDILPNPSLITVGTPIRVPKLSAVQRDTTNAQTRQRLESLKQEAEALSRK